MLWYRMHHDRLRIEFTITAHLVTLSEPCVNLCSCPVVGRASEAHIDCFSVPIDIGIRVLMLMNQTQCMSKLVEDCCPDYLIARVLLDQSENHGGLILRHI